MAVLLAFVMPVWPEEEKKTDSDRLQGRWTVLSGESNGELVNKDKIRATVVVFEKTRLYVEDKGHNKLWVMTFKLDPTKKPKTISMKLEEGKYKGASSGGIYALEGEYLKLCYALPNGKKPTSFKTARGSHDNSFLLKRSKSPEK
jgi:uncharacterized protein (TIGR03067 family)